MRYLLAILLILLAITAQAATPKRLVLMPVHIPIAEAEVAGTVSAAIIDGLSRRYTVISDDRVTLQVRKTFASGCDETKCFALIARAFHSDRIAVVNIIRQMGNFYLTLTVRNVTTNKALQSTSLTCRSCGVAEVLERLDELTADPQAVPVQSAGDGRLVWLPAPVAMSWRDARAYCLRIGARMPSLGDIAELYGSGTLEEQARLVGPIWSDSISGRATHYVVSPISGHKWPWDDPGLNYTACVR